MKKFIQIITMASTILMLAPFGANAATSSEQAKIEKLLGVIDNSDVTFIRNGKEYSAHTAVAHVRKKLDYAGDKIKTAADFIEKIATKSYLSGKPYYVKFSTGEKIPAGTWLLGMLDNLDELQLSNADRLPGNNS